MTDKTPSQDLARHCSAFTTGEKIQRLVWGVVSCCLFRPSPRPLNWWRSMLLRLFGARLGAHLRIDPKCHVFAPWNLEVGDWVVLGPGTEIHNVGRVVIGSDTMVSQYCFITSGTHDPSRPGLPLVVQDIHIGDSVWVCAGAFIGPGVTVGKGAVVAARAVVFQDVKEWVTVIGNPAKAVFPRRIVEDSQDA